MNKTEASGRSSAETRKKKILSKLREIRLLLYHTFLYKVHGRHQKNMVLTCALPKVSGSINKSNFNCPNHLNYSCRGIVVMQRLQKNKSVHKMPCTKLRQPNNTVLASVAHFCFHTFSSSSTLHDHIYSRPHRVVSGNVTSLS